MRNEKPVIAKFSRLLSSNNHFKGDNVSLGSDVSQFSAEGEV